MKGNLLIVYASRYGQTEKIARRIGEVAASMHVPTDIIPVEEAPDVPLGDYDSLIVAGGVYFGRHATTLQSFVGSKLAEISAMEAAFVSVSGSANEKYVHDFARRTGWVPEIYVSFKGGEAYTKYGFFTRLLMRMIARHEGRVVDVHRDYEHTDWEAVERFARDFIGYAAAKQSA